MAGDKKIRRLLSPVRMRRKMAILLLIVFIGSNFASPLQILATSKTAWEVEYGIRNDDGTPLASDDDRIRLQLEQGETAWLDMTLMEKNRNVGTRFKETFHLYVSDEIYTAMAEGGDIPDDGWLESDYTECGYLLEVYNEDSGKASESNASGSNASDSNQDDEFHKISLRFVNELQKHANPRDIEIEDITGSLAFQAPADMEVIITRKGNDCWIFVAAGQEETATASDATSANALMSTGMFDPAAVTEFSGLVTEQINDITRTISQTVTFLPGKYEVAAADHEVSILHIETGKGEEAYYWYDDSCEIILNQFGQANTEMITFDMGWDSASIEKLIMKNSGYVRFRNGTLNIGTLDMTTKLSTGESSGENSKFLLEDAVLNVSQGEYYSKLPGYGYIREVQGNGVMYTRSPGNLYIITESEAFAEFDSDGSVLYEGVTYPLDQDAILYSLTDLNLVNDYQIELKQLRVDGLLTYSGNGRLKASANSEYDELNPQAVNLHPLNYKNGVQAGEIVVKGGTLAGYADGGIGVYATGPNRSLSGYDKYVKPNGEGYGNGNVTIKSGGRLEVSSNKKLSMMVQGDMLMKDGQLFITAGPASNTSGARIYGAFVADHSEIEVDKGRSLIRALGIQGFQGISYDEDQKIYNMKNSGSYTFLLLNESVITGDTSGYSGNESVVSIENSNDSIATAKAVIDNSTMSLKGYKRGFAGCAYYGLNHHLIADAGSMITCEAVSGYAAFHSEAFMGAKNIVEVKNNAKLTAIGNQTLGIWIDAGDLYVRNKGAVDAGSASSHGVYADGSVYVSNEGTLVSSSVSEIGIWATADICADEMGSIDVTESGRYGIYAGLNLEADNESAITSYCSGDYGIMTANNVVCAKGSNITAKSKSLAISSGKDVLVTTKGKITAEAPAWGGLQAGGNIEANSAGRITAATDTGAAVLAGKNIVCDGPDSSIEGVKTGSAWAGYYYAAIQGAGGLTASNSGKISGKARMDIDTGSNGIYLSNADGNGILATGGGKIYAEEYLYPIWSNAAISAQGKDSVIWGKAYTRNEGADAVSSAVLGRNNKTPGLSDISISDGGNITEEYVSYHHNLDGTTPVKVYAGEGYKKYSNMVDIMNYEWSVNASKSVLNKTSSGLKANWNMDGVLKAVRTGLEIPLDTETVSVKGVNSSHVILMQATLTNDGAKLYIDAEDITMYVGQEKTAKYVVKYDGLIVDDLTGYTFAFKTVDGLEKHFSLAADGMIEGLQIGEGDAVVTVTAPGGRNTANDQFKVTVLDGSTTDRLKAKKDVTGRDLQNGEFTFRSEMIFSSGGGAFDTLTAKNDAAGDVLFRPYRFEKEGIYIFKITEDEGTDTNLNYDQEVFYAKAEITRETDGRLGASVTYGTDYDKDSNTVSGNGNTIPSFTNTVKGYLNIKKISSASGQPLAGAEFELSYKNAGTDSGWLPLGKNLVTEGENGSIQVELPDEYWRKDFRLIEIKAPSGYIGSETGTILFHMHEDGTVSSWSSSGTAGYVDLSEDGTTFTVKNPHQGYLNIKKISTSGITLQGAEFELSYRKAGSDSEWQVYNTTLIRSGAAGRAVIELPAGADGYWRNEYRLIETKAPAGYSQTRVGTILFTMNEGGMIETWSSSGASGYVAVEENNTIFVIKNFIPGGGGGGGTDPTKPSPTDPTPPTDPTVPTEETTTPAYPTVMPDPDVPLTPYNPGDVIPEGKQVVMVIDDDGVPRAYLMDIPVPQAGLARTGDDALSAVKLAGIMLAALSLMGVMVYIRRRDEVKRK